jgi:hypothetical protein
MLLRSYMHAMAHAMVLTGRYTHALAEKTVYSSRGYMYHIILHVYIYIAAVYYIITLLHVRGL